MSSDNDAVGTAGEDGKRGTVCVFCGSGPGKAPAHMAAAKELANSLHTNGIKLVYGGGTLGLMGEVSRTLVSLSGSDAVHGIIPSALMSYERSNEQPNKSEKNQTLPEEGKYGRTTMVPDMHTRKRMMAKEVVEGGVGGGFVALSGGYGTLEELMEMVTWNQLGLHAMPVIVYNVDGYYDGLIQWVKSAAEAGFVQPGNANIIVEAKDAEGVIAALKNYKLAQGRFNLDWTKA